MRDDRFELRAVPSADPIHLFHQLPVAFHQPRIQRVLLLEPVEVRQRQADVQVVGAGGQDVGARARRLAGDDGIDGEVEEEGLEPREERVEGFAAGRRKARAGAPGSVRRGGKRRGRAREHELARRQVVVRAGVDPEQLGVAEDLVERRALDLRRVPHDRLEDVAHLEVMRVALVVEDVASGNRGLAEVPDQGLLAQREIAKGVGVDLDDRGLADALEQVFPVGGRRGGGGRRGRLFHGSLSLVRVCGPKPFGLAYYGPPAR